jgi:hypothetical protein
MWRCFRQGTVHRSWPKRVYVENDPQKLLILEVGSAASDFHLEADPNLEGESFRINPYRFERPAQKIPTS